MGDVPAGVVTVTSTTPLPAGLTAVTELALTTVTLVAWAVPKMTDGGAGKAGPDDCHRSAAGCRARSRAQARDRRPVSELIGGRIDGRRPAGEVTVTSTTPVPAGLTVVDGCCAHNGERRRGRAEVDCRCARETGPRDRYRSRTGRRAKSRTQTRHGCGRNSVFQHLVSESIAAVGPRTVGTAGGHSFGGTMIGLPSDDMRNSQSNRGDAQPKLASAAMCRRCIAAHRIRQDTRYGLNSQDASTR